jgi:outer membrane protein TolC
LQAAQAALQTAKTNLSAAARRHDVGLATIADVLQAQTAVAQAQLTEQTAESNVYAARASLAVAIGLEPNANSEAGEEPESAQSFAITESVDSLIARAVRSRPDVAAARAVARQSEAQVRVARSLTLPSLTMGATTGRSFANIPTLEGRTYGLTFGVSVPIFSGLSRQYDVVAAQENAAAAVARADQLRLQAAAQVFSSYYALRTAAQRITTANDLLASATRSEEVARGRYAEGVGSVLDLLTAQTALGDARAQAVEARWTWYATFAQLARDAGVLDTRGAMRFSNASGGPLRSHP